MNILALSGPSFLLFYFGLMVVVCFVTQQLVNRAETIKFKPRTKLSDPYAIGYLQSGPAGVIRVAVISLYDRGILVNKGTSLKVNTSKKNPTLGHPVEKRLVLLIASGVGMDSILTDPELRRLCDQYQNGLARSNLMANDQIKAERLFYVVTALAVMLGFAGAKIVRALMRGHTNIMYLNILAIISVVLLLKMYNKTKTAVGERMLADLKSLFRGLYDRRNSIMPGSSTNELAFIAAVYGVAELPAARFRFIKTLFPKAGSTGSCGTSCGSGCGSSCGGGCGGCGG